MSSSIRPRNLRFPTRNYPLRTGGMLLGCLPIVMMLASHGVGMLTWASLAATTLVWPHMALLIARNSSQPVVVEKRNLVADTAIASFWLGATGFVPLPSVALLTMQATDKLAVGGARFLLQSWVWAVPAAIAGWTVYQPTFTWHASPATALACLPLLVFYPLAVGKLNFELARQLVEQRKELQRLNRDDALTGVANRRYWEEVAGLELSRHRRTQRPAMLLLIDLDDLHARGENHGPAAYESMLREVGLILTRESREIDTAGRLGDETFGLILPETEPLQALQCAERISAQIAALERNGLPYVSISIGMASNADGTLDASAWIARADIALYRAKAAGGGTVWADGHLPLAATLTAAAARTTELIA